MPRVDLTVNEFSRKLCEEASALRETSKLILADSKAALDRSQTVPARKTKRHTAKGNASG